MGLANLRPSSVVVTGASSGIGHAIAHEFARAGANIVLAARRGDVLEKVAKECIELGARMVIPYPTDITEAKAVQTLADTAVEYFGGIDVWVNDPGVGAMGTFDEIPIESHDQVIRINLMGYIHGAHAALPYFKRQGFGTLINMNSLGAWCPVPYAVSYSASKFGLRGFSDSLRGELVDWPKIHVCDVFPGCVDSPGLKNAANYTGRFMKPAPPLVSPTRVARAVVRLAHHPKPRTIIGSQAWGGRLANFLAPQLMPKAMAKFTQAYMKRANVAPIEAGNLMAPSRWSEIKGDWNPNRSRNIAFALAGLIGVGSVLALRRL